MTTKAGLKAAAKLLGAVGGRNGKGKSLKRYAATYSRVALDYWASRGIRYSELPWDAQDWTLPDCDIAKALECPTAVVKRYRSKLNKPAGPKLSLSDYARRAAAVRWPNRKTGGMVK